jgi:hypothetical protein
MYQTFARIGVVILTIAAAQHVFAEPVAFINDGAPISVSALGGEWKASSDYLEASGADRFLYANRHAGSGDVHIRARLSLESLEGSAASFVIGEDSHFGFNGAKQREIFVSGPVFDGVDVGGKKTSDFIERGKPFEFEAIRSGSSLRILIDGNEILSANVGNRPLGRFGFRPWRDTLRLYSFSAEGDLTDPPPSTQELGYSIPIIDLSRQTNRQVIVDREAGQYLGHPTTVLLEDGRTIITVYPKGHGSGAIVMKRSEDGGLTWSDRLPVPENWATSMEVPTIHRVVDKHGVKRLIVFSGLYPIRMAVSEDDGETWTPLEPIGDFGGIVTMASVERLQSGDYMALFHDDGRFLRGKNERGPFYVYKTISEDGGLTWGEPVVIATHPAAHLCEPGLIRSPDGDQIAVLLRENSRQYNSFVIFSDDEGETWTEPRELPASLTGDRHVGKYAPDGRLFISFRDTTRESPTAGDWVGWIGHYDDIVNGTEGQYRVRLMNNHKGADCTYPGVELLPDGTFVTTTYGHWTGGEEPYIVSVRFSMEELDREAELLPKEQAIFTSGKGGYHTYRIPSVIKAADGTLLAFCEGRKSGRSDSGDIDLLLRRSSDGGETWGPVQVVWDDGEHTCGNPCPVLDEDTGRMWLHLTHNLGHDSESEIISGTSEGTRTVWVTYSDDNGSTWARPKEITPDVKLPNWTWYATGPGIGIQLRHAPYDGRLVIPCDQKTSGDVVGYHSLVYYSDDHGESWKLGGVTDDGTNECQVIERRDGSLLLNMRRAANNDAHFRAIAVSTDGGASWSPLSYDQTLIESRCQASLVRHTPSGGIEPNVTLFSNPASRTERNEMTVRLSEDDGAGWSHSRTLYAGPSAYSCLVPLDDERAGCLYERGDESPYETITFVQFSMVWLRR